MGFKQTQHIGEDNQAKDHFYRQEFKQAKDIGYTDEQAHEHAKFMVEWYGHHFRKYA
jgi:hypothetical protein